MQTKTHTILDNVPIEDIPLTVRQQVQHHLSKLNSIKLSNFPVEVLNKYGITVRTIKGV